MANSEVKRKLGGNQTRVYSQKKQRHCNKRGRINRETVAGFGRTKKKRGGERGKRGGQSSFNRVKNKKRHKGGREQKQVKRLTFEGVEKQKKEGTKGKRGERDPK